MHPPASCWDWLTRTSFVMFEHWRVISLLPVLYVRYMYNKIKSVPKSPIAKKFSAFEFSNILRFWNNRMLIETVKVPVFLSWVWIYWSFTSHATIFQSYMWRHRCAGGLKKKLLYRRSESKRHRYFAGFFNVPVLHRQGTNLFIMLFRHTAQFSRFLRHAGDTDNVFSTLTPRRARGGQYF